MAQELGTGVLRGSPPSIGRPQHGAHRVAQGLGEESSPVVDPGVGERPLLDDHLVPLEGEGVLAVAHTVIDVAAKLASAEPKTVSV